MVKKCIITLAVAGAVLISAMLASSNTSASQWGMVWSDEFRGATVSNEWDVLDQNRDNMGSSHLAWKPSNVRIINNDYLEIKTQRHCVDSVDDPMNDSNASEAPCPSGKMTRYQSGKVKNGPKVVDGTQPFRAEIRAKFNWNGKNGTRPSLWMVNGQNLQNCNTNPDANDPYGELDIIEWYSYMPAYTWSSTHATCYHHGVTATWGNGWKTRTVLHSDEHRVGSKPGSLAYEWHIWTVEYDGETVKYFLDDKPIMAYKYHASPTDDPTIERTPTVNLTKLADAELIKKTFSEGWRFILNDYVEKNEDQKPIAASETFPKQTMLVDYVRLFQRGTGTQPVDTPEPSTGVEWTKRDAAGSRNWSAVASSADGTKLAAAAWGGAIHTSSDAGATWTERTNAGTRNWVDIASSADGMKLAAIYDWGGYMSTSDDGGASWVMRGFSGSPNWTSIASSADGTKLVVTAKDKSIYTSTNSGATWTEQTGSGNRKWTSVASSADGTKLVATVEGGAIYTSTNSGATWTERSTAGNRAWLKVASSADGTKLVATVTGGNVFVSTNSGATWIERSADGVHNWTGVTISDDGTKISATAGGGGNIFMSSDSGAAWVKQTSAGTPNWADIAGSADGTKLAAVVYGGDIYTTSNNPTAPSGDEQAIAAAETAVAAAENTKRPSDVTAAQTKVNAVQDPDKKAALQNRLQSVTNDINSAKTSLSVLLNQAQGVSTSGMTSATTQALQAQITASQQVLGADSSVAELQDSRDKLQTAINNLRADKTALQAAITAAENEPTYIRNDTEVAATLQHARSVQSNTNPSVDNVRTATEQLQQAVAAAKQKEQDAQVAAEAAVVQAETDKTQTAIDAAKVLVNKVQDPAKKAALQARLNAIVVATPNPPTPPTPNPNPTTPTTSATIPQPHGASVTISTNGDACYNLSSAKTATAPERHNNRILRDIADFTIDCTNQTANTGFTTQVTLTLSRRYNTTRRLTIAKIATNGTFKEDITSHVTFGTTSDGKYTTISYSLTDGGFGDEDGIANGVIVDPVGVYEEDGAAALLNGLAETGEGIAAVTLTSIALGGIGFWLLKRRL